MKKTIEVLEVEEIIKQIMSLITFYEYHPEPGAGLRAIKRHLELVTEARKRVAMQDDSNMISLKEKDE